MKKAMAETFPDLAKAMQRLAEAEQRMLAAQAALMRTVDQYLRPLN
jgi:hypothetical protein